MLQDVLDSQHRDPDLQYTLVDKIEVACHKHIGLERKKDVLLDKLVKKTEAFSDKEEAHKDTKDFVGNVRQDIKNVDPQLKVSKTGLNFLKKLENQLGSMIVEAQDEH